MSTSHFIAKTNRLEALSDAFFPIIMTIMVLEPAERERVGPLRVLAEIAHRQRKVARRAGQ